MTIKIDYKQKVYPETHIIARLSDLILVNIEILSIISRIYITLDTYNHNKSSTDDFKMAVRRICCMAEISGEISEEVAEEFYELWTTITDEDIGKVLEEVVALYGPYDLGTDSFDLSRDAKVYELDFENNFDVIFFDSYNSKMKKPGQVISVKGNVEFHECKKNICNFIPANKDYGLKASVKNKLDFMAEVHRMCSHGDFYIPTLYYNVKPQQDYLKENEYGFIEVIGIGELIKKYGNRSNVN